MIQKKNLEIIVFLPFKMMLRHQKNTHSIFASEHHQSFSINKSVHLQASWIHSDRFLYDMKKENIKRRLKWRIAGIETANQKEGQNTNWVSFDFFVLNATALFPFSIQYSAVCWLSCVKYHDGA